MRRLLALAPLLALQAQPVWAADRLAAITQTGILKVCAWPDYHRISYRSMDGQQWEGVDADLAKALAGELRVKAQFVDSNLLQVTQDLLQKRCDIAMFAIPITPERAQKLRFSKPTLFSDVHAVTTRYNRRIRDWSDIDRPGVVLSVLKGSLVEGVVQEKISQATVLLSPHEIARDHDVESGRADVLLTDSLQARRLKEIYDWAEVLHPPKLFSRTVYGFAMAPDAGAWADRVDRFVREIKRDGRLKQIATRYGLQDMLVTR